MAGGLLAQETALDVPQQGPGLATARLRLLPHRSEPRIGCDRAPVIALQLRQHRALSRRAGRLIRIEHQLDRFDGILGRRLHDRAQNRQVIRQQIPQVPPQRHQRGEMPMDMRVRIKTPEID